ncbi:Early flowering 4 [Melia azedarach]|uniref:Early flowering 4 n=2 Tax=Melia azedarach TaxID=155640 RepID=A0ACC1YA78_MELAZ|nr:Early flowering 4 [Melia azedarach]KAJ4720063.1 Early flowering 4 [Melia azedarach]
MHMSRLGSSESSMDNTSNTTITTATTTTNRRKLRQMTTAMNKRKNGRLEEEEGGGQEEGDPEVWETFNNNFRRVQSVLDRNRVLIQQVNENHQSRIPDNMVKNVALIQEINGNISKVVSLYSDLSTNFTGVYNQRNKNGDGGSRSGSGSEEA